MTNYANRLRGLETADHGKTRVSAAFRFLLALVLCAGLLPVFAPASASAAEEPSGDISHGTISITSDSDSTTVELSVGESITVTVYPYQHMQSGGCGLTMCPYGCPDGCWTAGIGCMCAADDSKSLCTAVVSITNSDPDAVSVSEGTLVGDEVTESSDKGTTNSISYTITAVAAGDATVTVSAGELDYWYSSTATYEISVASDGSDAHDAITQNADGAYEIDSVEDLWAFADIVNGYTDADGNEVAADPDADAVLTADIEGVGTLPAIVAGGKGNSGGYAGTFDGAGHTISGVTGFDSTYTSFFTYLCGGTIKDLTLASDGTVEVESNGAVFVYYARGGTIEGCVNEVSVVNSSSYYAGFVNSVQPGYASMTTTLTGCVNKGTIESGSSSGRAAGLVFTVSGAAGTLDFSPALCISECMNVGTITAAGGSAGLVAQVLQATVIEASCNKGAIVQSSSTASTNKGAAGLVYMAGSSISSPTTSYSLTIENCYNAGTVSSYLGVSGGMVANTSCLTYISSSYNSGEVSNGSTSGSVRAAVVARYGSEDCAAGVDGVYWLESSAPVAFGTYNSFDIDGAQSVTASELASLASALSDGNSVEYGGEEVDAFVDYEYTGYPLLYWESALHAAGHVYGAYSYNGDAACDADGTETASCVYCDAADTRAAEGTATGHTEGEAVVENEVAASCDEDGSYDSVVYCTVCGEELSREMVAVAATGHTAGDAVVENEVAASCTEDGSYDTVVYCSVCGEELSRETVTVAATGHDYAATGTVEPTCTEAGYTTYTCTVCGDTYAADETAALGHTAADAVVENEVAATASQAGSYDLVVYCSVCGEELSRETVEVAALGYSFSDVQDASAYYYGPVYAVAEAGYMTGMSDDVFGVGRSLNRQQMVTILYRVFAGDDEQAEYGSTSDSSEYADNQTPLTDVEDGAYYTAAVNWAYDAGVATGYSTGAFGVGDECSFQQFCTFLARALGQDAALSDDEAKDALSSFADGSKVAAYADNSVAYLCSVVYDDEGDTVVGGTAAGKLKPASSVSRERTATVVYRCMAAGLF